MLALVLLFPLLAQTPAEAAEVTHPWSVAELYITQRAPVLAGKLFGKAGAYERIVGEVVFHFDPENPQLQQVVDLEYAPLTADGHVEAVADLMILRPLQTPEDGGLALMEVSNRGGKASLSYFCRGRGGANPQTAADFGDALLLDRGVTIVWLGWQADVPDRPELLAFQAPRAVGHDGRRLQGLVRADWNLSEDQERLALGHRGHVAYLPVPGKEEEAFLTGRPSRLGKRTVVPREDWHFDQDAIAGSFTANTIYELVYTSQDPWVLGLGPAGMAQFAGYLKDSSVCEFPVSHTVAVGISQTGRFLRNFLYQGFNDLGEGRLAFDFVMAITAGAGRGSFNHRFGQPSRDAHQNSAFFYPTDLFPFTSRVQRDPATGERDGLLAKALASGTVPKLMQVNTGYEYWGRAAALMHTSLEGAADVPPLESERIYHLRGAQHFPVDWPRALTTELMEQSTTVPLFQGSPIDNRVVYRALLIALFDWVEKDTLPPPSRMPTIADGTLVPLDQYRLLALPGLVKATVAEEAYRVDYGPRWKEGVITREPPLLAAPFPTLVPQVDVYGNERSGVPTVETLLPLGTFLPWHLAPQRPDGEQALTDFYGSFLPFAPTKARHRAWGDKRRDLQSLYPKEGSYPKAVDQAIDLLLQERWLLPEDRERQKLEALRRFRILTGT